LGNFLSKSLGTTTECGFDLIFLDSICDRIGLLRTTVHELLIKFADPDSMRYTMIATTTQKAHLEGFTLLEVLKVVQTKLHELHKLASNLRPQSGSQYDEWHAIVQKRIRGFLNLIVGPRITALQLNKATISSTDENVPKEVQEDFQLNYLYEAMQQHSMVPLSRYGMHPDSPSPVYVTPYLSFPLCEDEGTERARNNAIHLTAENYALRTKIADLEQDKEELIKSNEKLAQKVGKLSRGQPKGYIHQAASNDSSSNGQLAMTPNRSARKYGGIFSRLQDSLLPELRLLDPLTGELSPARPHTPTLSKEKEKVTAYVEGEMCVLRSERGSGGFFDVAAVEHLAGLSEEGANGGNDADEDGCEITTIVPSTTGRKQFDLLE